MAKKKGKKLKSLFGGAKSKRLKNLQKLSLRSSKGLGILKPKKGKG